MKALLFAGAFFGGAILSFLCYLLAKWVLKHRDKYYFAVSMLRQLIGVAYLAALFFLGRGKDGLYLLLLGGALGITLPALFLTARLLKIPAETAGERKDDNG